MAAFRMGGARALSNELLCPGDTILTPDIFSPNVNVGAVVLTAAQMVTGVLFRSGSTAAYNDTLDTAVNVLAAVSGNLPAAAVIPGLSFKLRLINSVAFIDTITLGAGMVAGSGTIATVPASSWRDFLFTFASVQPPVSVIGNTVSGSAVVTWTFNAGQTALTLGPSPSAANIMPGAAAVGTGIAAGTTVLGVTEIPGGTSGCTLSGTATATGSNVAITFGPQLVVSGMGSGTL